MKLQFIEVIPPGAVSFELAFSRQFWPSCAVKLETLQSFDEGVTFIKGVENSIGEGVEQSSEKPISIGGGILEGATHLQVVLESDQGFAVLPEFVFGGLE